LLWGKEQRCTDTPGSYIPKSLRSFIKRKVPEKISAFLPHCCDMTLLINSFTHIFIEPRELLSVRNPLVNNNENP
jgi:hypothetical protein